MRIKIMSDGTSTGTRIVDEATGEELQNVVTSLTWELDAKVGVAKVQLGMIAGIEAVAIARPILGYLHGEAIYTYDWDVWCNDAFISTHQYVPTEEEIAKIVDETRALLRI